MSSEHSQATVRYANASDRSLFLPQSEIDAYGTKAAEWCGYKPGGDVLSVVKSLGGEVIYDDPTGSPDGGTIFVDGHARFRIYLSTWTSPRRDQFTLAHELGHYFLHSQLGKVPLFAARTGSGRSEWEANWFAAGFLMPRGLFAERYKSGVSIARLAEEFNVSARAADIRRQSLRLSRTSKRKS